MECFKVENLSFAYPNAQRMALHDISFTAKHGEFVLVCGKSGCGKTTLLRLLKSSLSPFGQIEGHICFDGKPLACYDTKEQAARIGFVMQNPDNQLVCDKVWHELAFGLESLGFAQNEIRTRVSEMASFFGIQPWFHKNVSELSGGQKQLVNLASVMVMQPSVLILDEPTSQLDPIAAAEFLQTIAKINRELGVGVILSEHRLEDAFPMADRVIVMDGGTIIANDEPRAAGQILKDKNHDMHRALPTPMRVHGQIPNSLPCPLTVRDGRVWLGEYAKENFLNHAIIPKDALERGGETVVQITDAWFRYEKHLSDVIKGLSVSVQKGELFCIVGGNGAGKTTALSLMSGQSKPYRGDVLIKGQSISKIKNPCCGLIGALPQNPQSVFVKKTVRLDLMDMLSESRLSKSEKEQKVQEICALCALENLADSHPYDLSGGEQQRAALAKILLADCEILLLDEPTKGMDAHFKEEFAHILAELKCSGVTVVMVSHDIEFCAQYADRCALFFDGGITSSGSPREFFRGNSFYTTAANRMARACLPDAVLAEDIVLACGGKPEPSEPKEELNLPMNRPAPEPTPPQPRAQGLSKSTLMSCLLILLLIPLTICAGVFLLHDRKYYFISLLIILETMIPFCMAFESRKPRARELVIISVLCAIAVAGRAAFFMLPQFKPVAAVVIVAGVCFGGETGFLVGAVSAFVSNFFFGHGPWTPWQMFAFGSIGFLAGVLFQSGIVKKSKLPLCIFGFIVTLVIYGGIMNPASVIMHQSKISWELIASACAMGLPFDLIHAFSSAFFLWFISEPMVEKLERVKIKYGLV